MILRLSRKRTANSSFYWGCSSYPECKQTLEYSPPENRFDFSNDDFTSILRTLDQKESFDKEEIENEIKVQMIQILEHFISCTWGAHYNTLFDLIIKPYLTNPSILDYVLKGECVKENRGNVIRGKTGAKIYPELLYYLKKVESDKIQNYLDIEFGKRMK
jgi:ssDNA-binding Zn-finger/Zn-ribbon topoisomerase 1